MENQLVVFVVTAVLLLIIGELGIHFFSITGMAVSVTEGNYTLEAWSNVDDKIVFYGTPVNLYAKFNGTGNCILQVENKSTPMIYNTSEKYYYTTVQITKGVNNYNISCGNLSLNYKIYGSNFTLISKDLNESYLKTSALVNITPIEFRSNLKYPFPRKVFEITINDTSIPIEIGSFLGNYFTSNNCSNLLISLRKNNTEYIVNKTIINCENGYVDFIIYPNQTGDFFLIIYRANETTPNSSPEVNLTKISSLLEAHDEKIYSIKWINSTDFVAAGMDYVDKNYKWLISLYDDSLNKIWEIVHDNAPSETEDEKPLSISIYNKSIAVVGYDREYNPDTRTYNYRWVVLDFDFSGNLKWKYSYGSSDIATDAFSDGEYLYVLGKTENPSAWEIIMLNKNGSLVRSFNYTCGKWDTNFPHTILKVNNTLIVGGRCDSGTPTGWIKFYNISNGENYRSLNLTSLIPYQIQFFNGYLWDIALNSTSSKFFFEKRNINGTVIKRIETDLDGNVSHEYKDASFVISPLLKTVYISGYKYNDSEKEENSIVESYNLTNMKMLSSISDSGQENELLSIDLINNKIVTGGYFGSNWMIELFSPFKVKKERISNVDYIILQTKKITGKIGKWIRFSSYSNLTFPIKILGDEKNFTTYSNESVNIDSNNTWIQIEPFIPANFSNCEFWYEVEVSDPFKVFIGNSTINSDGRVISNSLDAVPIYIKPDKTVDVEIKYFDLNSSNVSKIVIKGNSTTNITFYFQEPIKYIIITNNSIAKYGKGEKEDLSINVTDSELIRIMRDFNSPKASLYLSKNTIYLGDVISVNCSYSDDTLIKNVLLFAEKDGKKIPVLCNSTFKPNDTGTYVFFLNVSDYFSWTNISKTLSVLKKQHETSSSSLSSSGIGTPASSNPISASVTQQNNSMNKQSKANLTTTVEVTYIDLRGIRLISIGAPIKVKKIYETSEDIETFVTKTLPRLLSRIKIYKTLEIETPKEPKKAYIYFNVSKNWLRKNGIDKKDVAAYEVKNSSVKKLKTEIIGETENVVEYRAVTTGFSYIVIGAEKPSCVESTHICVNNSLFVCKKGRFVLEKTCSFGCNNSTGTCIEKTSTRKSYYYYLSILALIPVILYVFVKKKPENNRKPKRKKR